MEEVVGILSRMGSYLSPYCIYNLVDSMPGFFLMVAKSCLKPRKNLIFSLKKYWRVPIDLKLCADIIQLVKFFRGLYIFLKCVL